MSENNNDLKDLENLLIEDIQKSSMIMLYINREGDVIMFSTGEYSKEQQKIAEKILVTVGSHSFIFSLILKLEIFFSRLVYSFSNMFKKIKK